MEFMQEETHNNDNQEILITFLHQEQQKRDNIAKAIPFEQTVSF